MDEQIDDDVNADTSSPDRRHSFIVERAMVSSVQEIFDAWTIHFDRWFAATGEIAMSAMPGEPYWFNVVHEGQRYAHYGRFLRVEEGRLIEQTWVTGRNGTDCAETVVRVELTPIEGGTLLRLEHEGFYDATSARRHHDSWPTILEHLDATLRKGA
ncbi:MAG TPA: SRPBCC domain-containing protein [Acidimicrobiales bacterium]|nr:SRPBCC domain-containing protein [Acidimicrobiales bacterium]